MIEYNPSLLRIYLNQIPMLRAVAVTNPKEQRLWRACVVCTYAEYRLPACSLDPRMLLDADINAWSARCMMPDESVNDPAELYWTNPYWIEHHGELIGTIAIAAPLGSWMVELSSLYLFTEQRHHGYGRRLITALDAVSRSIGSKGLCINTYWVWQAAVWFYVRLGFLVQHWKRGLRLVRRHDDPPYHVTYLDDQMSLSSASDPHDQLLLVAHHDDATLIWTTTPAFTLLHDGQRAWELIGTMALWLALYGWPLIRSPEEWAQRYDWLHIGMPEGLASKIMVWEAYTRHCGFIVATPRISGLIYADWETL